MKEESQFLAEAPIQILVGFLTLAFGLLVRCSRCHQEELALRVEYQAVNQIGGGEMLALDGHRQI